MTKLSSLIGRKSLLIAALRLIILGYALFVAWLYVDGYQSAARGEVPLYTDYTATYGASLLVREIPAEFLYVPRFKAEADRRAAQAMYGETSSNQAHAVGFSRFMYPPTFILVVAGLAYFPYLLSWFLWLGLTAIPYLMAMGRILPKPWAWTVALAGPPVFYNVIYGQNGFLISGLIALGLSMLQRQPAWAGVLIGLASVKPHLGLLIPVALIAGGYWRTFSVAALTVAGTIGASLLAYGDDPWFAFIGTSLYAFTGFEAGAFNLAAMASVFSALSMAGVPQGVATAVQGACAALTAGLVAWTWRQGRLRPELSGINNAILCLATPLALPMVYLYDIVLVVPAVAWIWQSMQANRSRHWEYLALIGTFAGILAVKPIAGTWGIQTGALLIGLLLTLALRQYRLALHTPQLGQALTHAVTPDDAATPLLDA